MIRYGSLSIEFNEICYYASMTDVGYLKLKGLITQLKSEMMELSGNLEEKRVLNEVGKGGDEKRKNITVHEVSSNASFDINLENEPSDKDVVAKKLQEDDELFFVD
ncbi:hypothetical protein WN944_018275 [Citrus x changshan-huyou]|uniref:Uncharacterized protein n=1 Tax=Citrus x changshan-huyou TaxID=2935761 RepID=A0AAP0LU07_9ROSI